MRCIAASSPFLFLWLLVQFFFTAPLCISVPGKCLPNSVRCSTLWRPFLYVVIVLSRSFASFGYLCRVRHHMAEYATYPAEGSQGPLRHYFLYIAQGNESMRNLHRTLQDHEPLVWRESGSSDNVLARTCAARALVSFQLEHTALTLIFAVCQATRDQPATVFSQILSCSSHRTTSCEFFRSSTTGCMHQSGHS